MEQNFTNIAERIEQRRLAIINALEAEAKAIEEAEPKLLERYEQSVQNVLNGLISSTEEQGQELFGEFKKSNDLLRKNLIKTRKILLLYLLPFSLIIGIAIGISGTVYYNRNLIKIDTSRIVISKDKTLWYQISIDEAQIAASKNSELKGE